MSSRKKSRPFYSSPAYFANKKKTSKKRDKAKVFGTKNSSRIQFSPEAEYDDDDDYVTPQMNQILTLPRAPVKPFKKRFRDEGASSKSSKVGIKHLYTVLTKLVKFPSSIFKLSVASPVANFDFFCTPTKFISISHNALRFFLFTMLLSPFLSPREGRVSNISTL